MNFTPCPSRGLGSIASPGGVCQARNLSLIDHTLLNCPEPGWQKMAQSLLNGTIQPVDIKEEG